MPTLYRGGGILPAGRMLTPVPGADVEGQEDMLIEGETLHGRTLADLRHRTPHTIPTTVADTTIGDADLTGPPTASLPMAWDGHATVVAAGAHRTVVFASDRPGTRGGTDLWYVDVDGRGQVRRLSATATACDEIAPFYDAVDDMLYYASAGGATLGGYDVMRVRILHRPTHATDSMVVGTAENVGAPINSPFDDIFPVISRDSVIVTSNRRAGTDFDVWATARRDLRPVAHTSAPTAPPQGPQATVTGTVVLARTQQPVADADITIRDRRSRSVVTTTTTDRDGRYTATVPTDVPLDVVAQHDRTFHDETTVTIPRSQAGRTVPIDHPLSLPTTYFLRINFPTAMFDTPYGATLDSNGMDTDETWTEALDGLAENLLRTNQGLRRVILIGHTDDVGTDASNTLLGQRRVDFVIDQLVRRGVHRDLLEGRSAGERLLPDRRPNEEVDRWRKRARRVELVKVLER